MYIILLGEGAFKSTVNIQKENDIDLLRWTPPQPIPWAIPSCFHIDNIELWDVYEMVMYKHSSATLKREPPKRAKHQSEPTRPASLRTHTLGTHRIILSSLQWYSVYETSWFHPPPYTTHFRFQLHPHPFHSSAVLSILYTGSIQV